MSKFKVKFKIQALELEIEGERAAVPQLTDALKQHVSNMLAAPTLMALDGQAPQEKNVTPIEDGRTNRKRARSGPRQNGAGPSAPIEFRHDTGQWGSPKQTWNTQQKAIWLLFVAENQAGINEMAGTVIAATFNKHFREAKAILYGNVNRDLGKAKNATPSLVGEDVTKTPPAWYLTSEGKNAARKLVAEATGAPITP